MASRGVQSGLPTRDVLDRHAPSRNNERERDRRSLYSSRDDLGTVKQGVWSVAFYPSYLCDMQDSSVAHDKVQLGSSLTDGQSGRVDGRATARDG